MREIVKTVSVRADGKPADFRLTKLDAFSGVALLRMLAKIPGPSDVILSKAEGCSEGSHPGGQFSPALFFSSLSEPDLRSLMTSCLEHTEVLLPAGWMPVMTRGEWTYPELEHDTAVCLKLCIEEVLWTLEGFFGGGGSTSLPEIPGS